jgi:hypothetical protein
MKYLIIENDINLIRNYDAIGVDRIFLDLEILGKKERQGHLNTVISQDHHIDDVKRIAVILKNSQLLVRINPIHENSEYEIEKCIKDGADILMLPMFKTKYEVEFFLRLVKGRVTTCLLLETSEAFTRIDNILELDGIDEIYIGLNDLHLSLGLDFMFEVLSCGLVDYLSTKITSKGIVFGFGGVATLNGGLIPGSMVLKEHVRLKSSMVILSRTFKQIAQSSMKDFEIHFSQLRDNFKYYKTKLSVQELYINKIEFKSKVTAIVSGKKL